MDNNKTEIVSGWRHHLALDRKSSVNEMRVGEQGIVDYLGSNIITSADEPKEIEAYKNLRRQQLRLVEFEGRPYAVETIQEVWGETDREANLRVNIYFPIGENPTRLAHKLSNAVDVAIMNGIKRR
jgi:hypothetical protein